jgi:hypothetical protein
LATNEQKSVLENISKKLNDIQEIEFHRSIANRQKIAYNNMIKDLELLENHIIIEVIILHFNRLFIFLIFQLIF